MAAGLEGNFNGDLALFLFVNKDSFQLVQVVILNGGLEKILECVIERTFAAAVFTVNKEIFTADSNLVSAVKSLVVGDLNSLDSHFFIFCRHSIQEPVRDELPSII